MLEPRLVPGPRSPPTAKTGGALPGGRPARLGGRGLLGGAGTRSGTPEPVLPPWSGVVPPSWHWPATIRRGPGQGFKLSDIRAILPGIPMSYGVLCVALVRCSDGGSQAQPKPRHFGLPAPGLPFTNEQAGHERPPLRLIAQAPSPNLWRHRLGKTPTSRSSDAGSQPSSIPSFGETLRVFGKVGFLSFGGPAAQIALMHRVILVEERWVAGERAITYARSRSACCCQGPRRCSWRPTQAGGCTA